MDLKHLIKPASEYITKNSPRILTILAASGVFSTAVLAAKATPEAVRRVLDAQSEMTTVTTLDKARLMAPCYIPAAAMGVVTVACVIGAHSVHTRRTAAIASAYSITEKALVDYRNKVIESHGSESDASIIDAVAADEVNRHEPGQVVILGKGSILTYDTLSGRYFSSDAESIKAAVNALNSVIINEGFASQNDFYRHLGLAALPTGEDIGWSSSTLLDIRITSMLNEENTPCLALSYLVAPKANYYRGF